MFLLFVFLLVLTASIGLPPPEALNFNVTTVEQSDQTGKITLPNSFLAERNLAVEVNSLNQNFINTEDVLNGNDNQMAMLQTTNKTVVVSNYFNFMASDDAAFATNLRNGSGCHILKTSVTSACLENVTG